MPTKLEVSFVSDQKKPPGRVHTLMLAATLVNCLRFLEPKWTERESRFRARTSNSNVSRSSTSRPKSELDCLTCAMLARERLPRAGGSAEAPVPFLSITLSISISISLLLSLLLPVSLAYTHTLSLCTLALSPSFSLPISLALSLIPRGQ